MAGNRVIRRLLARIDELKGENQDLESRIWGLESDLEAAHEHSNKQEATFRRRMRDMEYEREAEESRARSKEWEIQDALQDLRRAKNYGDSWGCERALRRLNSI